jgi:molybdopterin-guanine dinucleotide biosynthesis protein A
MYHQRVDGVAGFVLAGGRSTRMGRDKAFLELGGRTLLARALSLAGTVAEPVRIVGASESFLAHGRVVEDLFPGRGPLGGIHAALRSSAAELNLMLAVDLPSVDPRFLAYLVNAARQSSAVVTLPHAAGGWQPLCAVYRREFTTTAEHSLREGSNRIDTLLVRVAIRVIAEEELEGEGFSGTMFRNLNTPEELEGAELSLRSTAGTRVAGE